MEYLNNLSCWDWFALAMLLLLLEVFVNKAFFLWFGVSAGVVGVLVLMAPHLRWQTQLMFFSVGVFASILMWLLYCRSKSRSEIKSGLLLACEKESYIGRSSPLKHTIEGDSGNVLIDDPDWVTTVPDSKQVAVVKAVEEGDAVLRVEKVSP